VFEARKIKETQPALFQAAKEKLKNWKLTDNQIEQILSSDKKIEQFPILANVSGFVTKKMVNLGDYIKQGQPIYEIADLSKVWILFDVYESDMSWIKKGASVDYTVQSVPGRSFKGTISYLDPVIDPKTRVAKARVETSNKELLLKPEMFTSGTVLAQVKTSNSLISVPKTAVMWTGKRSVVYVMQSSAQGVNFRMREVTLGPELGESYVIESGIQEGEEIAINGTFSIDAAAQLTGKPSMMSPEGGVAMSGHAGMNMGGASNTSTAQKPIPTKKTSISTEAKNALQPLYEKYFKLKSALAADDFEKAKEAGTAMKEAHSKVNMSLFKGQSHDSWMQHSAALNEQLQHINHSGDITALRTSFISISKSMIALTESFDPFDDTIYLQHCPMADSNKGADWLSQEKEIRNPYFGESMLTCGEVTKEIN
jgi:Cu(I)/Ag(I) efflux system membrane fusion protein